ncbi:50S ribosomal protein L23 [Candidatus Saccharibacteria bacterium]|nr:50S ribosomal protein L23 [Candidatus Saccharibacteria bacterium]
MLIRPIQTEKAYREEAKRGYMFMVPNSASKQAIAKQVSEQYQVTVLSVRTAIRKGKPTRFSRGKHAYPGTTYRQDHKIAFVTLKEGDKIKVFNEPAAEESDKGGDK